MYLETVMHLKGIHFIKEWVEKLDTTPTIHDKVPAVIEVAVAQRGRKPGAAPESMRCKWKHSENEGQCKNKRGESGFCLIHQKKAHLIENGVSSS
jgi:hypothetical protein